MTQSPYPTGSLETRPLAGLVTALTIMLGVAGTAALVGVYPYVNRIGAIDDFRPDPVSFAELVDADDLVLTMLVVNLLATVATGVVFMIWQYRLARNAEELRDRPLSLGPGWAVGGWFVPFANFALPYLQLRQSVRASDPDLPPGEPYSRGRVPGIVTVWTVLFIAGTLLMVIGANLRGRPEDYLGNPEEFTSSFANGDRIAALAMLVTAAAAGAAIRMVRTVTARHDAALARRLSPM